MSFLPSHGLVLLHVCASPHLHAEARFIAAYCRDACVLELHCSQMTYEKARMQSDLDLLQVN